MEQIGNLTNPNIAVAFIKFLSKSKSNVLEFFSKLKLFCFYLFYYSRRAIFPRIYHLHIRTPKIASYSGSDLSSMQRICFLGHIVPTSAPVTFLFLPFGAPLTPDSIPTYSIFSVYNNLSICHNPVFWLSSQVLIDKGLKAISSLPEYNIDTPILAPSYSTNHFGHFCAEVLGTLFHIVNYSNQLTEPHSVFLYAPSPSWKTYLVSLFPNVSFFTLPSKSFGNYKFSSPNARIFPLLSPWQGLSYARNIILSRLSQCQFQENRRIFLNCANRRTVHNAQAFEAFLYDEGFEFVDPLSTPVSTLFSQLHTSPLVLCEQGSIVFNVLLSRIRPTIVLTPSNIGSASIGEFSGGILFNSLADGSFHEFYCQPVFSHYRKHVYSQAIIVNIDELRKAIYTLASYQNP